MVDTCIIRRQTGLVTDPATGNVTPGYETVYPTAAHIATGNNGKCKVQTFTNRELLKNGGEYEFVIQRYEVQVPVAATGIQTNDEVVVTASLFDPDLPGRMYRIVGLMNKSLGTARRMGVEEMPS
jgi:hypothetical protein